MNAEILDPNVTLPKAVREQAEQADMAIEAAREQEEEESLPQHEPAPQPDSDQGDVEEQLRIQKQQNVALQGKYDAEVPRLSQELRDLKGQLNEMENSPEEPEEPETPAHTRHISDEIKEEYGDELLQVTGDVARGVVEDSEKRVNNRLHSLESQVADWRHRAFLSELGRLIPSYTEINTRDSWLTWLGEKDELSGIVRQEMLNEATGGADADRASRIFEAFLGSDQGRLVRDELSRSSLLGEERPSDGLELLQQPDVSGVGAPASATVASWKRSQIKDFYKDVTKGRYANDPDRAAAMETEITDALAAGNVLEG